MGDLIPVNGRQSGKDLVVLRHSASSIEQLSRRVQGNECRLWILSWSRETPVEAVVVATSA